MDGAVRAEPGSAGIGGVLWSSKGEVLLLFSKNVGVTSPMRPNVGDFGISFCCSAISKLC